jgi:hypothetical protein
MKKNGGNNRGLASLKNEEDIFCYKRVCCLQDILQFVASDAYLRFVGASTAVA